MDKRFNLASTTLQFHPFYQRNICLSQETVSLLTSQVETFDTDPIARCHFAISIFHEMLETNSATLRLTFLKLAENIRGEVETWQIAGRNCGVLPHRKPPNPHIPYQGPWISCQAQGWGMSVLMRAFQLTNIDSFRRAALSLQIPFLIGANSGGLRLKEKTGKVFFEKLPFGGMYRHILNGFLSSLIGLYELKQAGNDSLTDHLLNEGLETICCENVLETFDLGYTSTYGQFYKFASPACVSYNPVHVRQLVALSILTRQANLNRWAEKWHNYSTFIPFRARASFDCMTYRIKMVPAYSRRITRSFYCCNIN